LLLIASRVRAPRVDHEGMPRTAVLAVAALVVASSSLAYADTPADTPAEQTTSYRVRSLAIDAPSIGLFVGGLALDEDGADAMMGLGVAGAIAGVPILHLTRGHYRRAGASLALRTLVPLVTTAAFSAASSCPDDEMFCAAGKGFAFGLVLASVIDAATMTDEVRPAPPPARAWTPSLAVTGGGVQVGVGFSL
jgi:hypothetical protein